MIIAVELQQEVSELFKNKVSTYKYRFIKKRITKKYKKKQIVHKTVKLDLKNENRTKNMFFIFLAVMAESNV